MSVFENREEEIGNRMDALKLSRKFEAKRIAPQTVHVTRREEVDRKEAWREYEISQLQMKIVLATMDHPPKGWDDDLRSPDYLPPPGDSWPPTGRTPDGRLILFPDQNKNATSGADRVLNKQGGAKQKPPPGPLMVDAYCISNLLASKNSFPTWGFVNSFPTWGFADRPFVDLSI